MRLLSYKQESTHVLSNDENTMQSSSRLKVGDTILVKRIKRHKLQTYFEDRPGIVVKVFRGGVVIEKDGIRFVRPLTQVKKYFSNTGDEAIRDGGDDFSFVGKEDSSGQESNEESEEINEENEAGENGIDVGAQVETDNETSDESSVSETDEPPNLGRPIREIKMPVRFKYYQV